MANENNNIKELVSEDDDPTAELEIPSFPQHEVAEDLQAEPESESHTCGISDSKDAEKPAAQSIPELQSDLRSRGKTIGQLQYDIQQLRSKWLGLESEISAREEIVTNLLGDTDKLNKKITRKDKLLKKRSASIKSLKVELRQHEKEQSRLKKELAQRQESSEQYSASLAEAENELRLVRDDLQATQKDFANSEDELKHREESYASVERQLTDQLEVSKQQAAALEEANGAIERLKLELEAAEKEEHNLNTEINLRDGLESTLEQQISEFEEQVAVQRSTESEHLARLEAATQEIAQLKLDLEAARHNSAAQILQSQNTTSSVVKEMRAQLEKTEQYADTLRFKLETSDESLSLVSERSEKLSAEVAALASQNSELSGELEGVQAANEELLAAFDQLRADHEQEIRTIRFELTEAQQSITQAGDVNEQLNSDLESARDSKDEFERTLLQKEEIAQTRISELEKQLGELADSADDFEQKLDTKNTAINVLLGELAKKTEQIDSISEIEDVIQEIDTRMSERFDEPGIDSTDQKVSSAIGADRITRVLVGNIGNQELRFPLFKNRLTIGRTAENDIQLKTSYISRRHAVVLTEGDATRVIDWGSKNGVYVNSERVKECFLSNGDIVSVGNAKFRYEERPKRETGH